jgi:F420-dependent oxidoreductase-like protein
MRISTNVGFAIDRPRTIAEMIEEVRRAADLGLGGAWWAERPTADALTVATVAGLAVPELPLGTAVVTTYPRHPLALASQALTVQAATGNRLTLGIGPGHRRRVEGSLGMTFDRPALHIREYLSALMPLLRGESVEFSGEIHHVAGQVDTPGARPPSVLLAALRPVMLRVAGELADGTVTIWTGVRTVATDIAPRITAAADAAGRPAPRIVVNLPIAVTEDFDGARNWVAEHFGASATSYRAMVESEGSDVVVVGDERQVEKELRRFADAGATEFIAVPFGSREQVSRTLAFLGNLNLVSGTGVAAGRPGVI